MGAVANKYDVSISQLKKWNNLKSNSIAYGRNLKIIRTETTSKVINKDIKIDNASSELNSKNQAVASKSNKEEKTIATSADLASVYVVQKGDNLGSIAQKYNVTVAEIQEWNNLANENVQFGISLQVAKKELSPKEDIAIVQERKDIEYTVQKGDNLGGIATKFGSSLAELKQWNKLRDNTISVGKNLIVAKDEVVIVTDKATVNSFKTKANNTAASNKATTDYYVKKGDSLFSIAKKYPGITISDLKKWNDIRNEDIKPGMKLKING